MPQLTDAGLQTLLERAEQYWREPSPQWSHGGDKRSSDGAFLVLFYGGLVSAERQGWLNAGRRMIDKTYLDIFLHARCLKSARTCSPEQIAAALDNQFIPHRLAPCWAALAELSPSAAPMRARELVAAAADELFGSLRSEVLASQLLFQLLPQLPIFPFSRGHAQALSGLDGQPPATDYSSYAARCALLFAALRAQLEQAPPRPHYGFSREQATSAAILRDSDWWPRRLFDLYLQQQLPQADFGCDGDGQ